MNNHFKQVFDGYVSEYKRNLCEFYPCETDAQATLPEANLTTSFLLSCRLKGPYSESFVWNEFSVKGMCVEPGRQGSNMDGFLLDKNKKHILLIESKRLKYSKEKGLHNEKDDGVITLSSDMAREINVANSMIFPTRIWNCEADHPFTSLGIGYNQYRTFGVSLVSTWIENGCLTKEIYAQSFKDYLDRAFVNTRLSQALCGLGLPNVNSSSGWLFCEDISALFPLLQKKRWQYFVLMYVWEIEKREISEQAFAKVAPVNLAPPLMGREAFDCFLLHSTNGLIDYGKKCPVYTYLWPHCFANQMSDKKRYKNNDLQLWIDYKTDKIVLVITHLSSLISSTNSTLPWINLRTLPHCPYDIGVKRRSAYGIELGLKSALDNEVSILDIEQRAISVLNDLTNLIIS